MYYPILLIVVGAVVLLFGKRISVLGAAVGAMLGVSLLHLFTGIDGVWVQLGLVAALTVGGFFLAGIAKGIVNLILIVLCVLAGATIAIGFLDLFNFTSGSMDWLIALIGGVAGWVLYSRFHEGAMAILAGLIGGLLVTRGLTVWMPFLEGWAGTLLTLVLAGAGIGIQTGFFANRKAAKEQQAAAAQVQPAVVSTPTTPTPATPVPSTPAAGDPPAASGPTTSA